MDFTNSEKTNLAALGYKLVSDCYATNKGGLNKSFIRKMEDGTVSVASHSHVTYGPGENQWMVVHVFSTYSTYSDWRVGKVYPPKQKIWWDQDDSLMTNE